MGSREMILVLLAIVLFTRLAMISNRSMLLQVDQLQHSTYILQATNLAQRYMDEIDAKLYGKLLTIDNVATTYNGTRTVQPIANDMNYTVNINVTNCDSLGASSAATTGCKKVTVVVTTQPASIQSVTMSRLYKTVE